ncbi:uncharacterized protein LOC114667794 isoform X1 [Erpetoichthys calabaricus]|uniref:uncharacterized protein LOC114667794 isoform X1 n=1 Tax=Erpetoichthys calabaricus TaxID=27687 RepID=UPI0022346CC5|nr:uncharacterized protein LOC114667794 isoform X1 [Erpetoichthys calabaricus]
MSEPVLKNITSYRDRGKEEAAGIYCNIKMNVKEETCEADIMTVSIKGEECEWESSHSKQESLCIKDERCELGSVGIKEESKDMSFNIKTHEHKIMKCVDLKVSSESLQSDTKRTEEMFSVRTREDQPSSSNCSGQITSFISDHTNTGNESCNSGSLDITPPEQCNKRRKRKKMDVSDMMEAFLDMQKKHYDEFMRGEELHLQKEREMLNDWMKAQMEMEERRQQMQREERQEANRMFQQMMNRMFDAMVPIYQQHTPSHPNKSSH